MADYQIEITGVKGFGFHGLLESERKNGQEFSVDAVLLVRSESVNDKIENTVNYASVAQIIHDFITGTPVDLIETLADLIADELFSLDLVSAVELTINKPNAPIEVPFENVSVTVFREE